MSDVRPGTAADRARWRRYLADERAEAAVYRELAARRGGEEREILLALAAAEGRHEAHWLALLGGDDSGVPRADIRTRMLGALARRFGSIFVLALAQRAEARSPYATDPDATPAMPVKSTTDAGTPVAPMPSTSARLDTRPSLAPNTAARKVPARRRRPRAASSR